MREVLPLISDTNPDIAGTDKEHFEEEMPEGSVFEELDEMEEEKRQDQTRDIFGEEAIDPEDPFGLTQIGHFLYLMLGCCAALIMIGSVIWFFSNYIKAPDTEETTTKQYVVMEQTEEDAERIEDRSEDARNHREETEGSNDHTWQETVFGEIGGKTITGRIRVMWPDEEGIAGSGYSESSFIKAAGYFLNEEGIKASAIRFKEKIETSAGGAYAWKAVIEGNTNLGLLVLWYKEYPDKYILALMPEEENASSHENRTGSSQQVASVPGTTQPEIRQNTQPTQRTTERSYDATRLSVKGIPETLLNYINNRYDLQYSLYDYLYKNGHRNVDSVQVTGYEIDPDRKEAMIYLRTDDGISITGIYSRTGNSFSYRRS